jgi:apolipoprotein N-acyltransferase
MFPAVYVSKRRSLDAGLLYMLFAWMVFELLQNNLAIGTPFFSLGFGLGTFPDVIQIYEYIGIEGAAAIIIASNLLVYKTVASFLNNSFRFKYVIQLLTIAGVFVCSPLLKKDFSHTKHIQVSALHTFTETYSTQLHQKPEIKLIELAKLSKLDQHKKKTPLLVWPETIISNVGWLHNMTSNRSYTAIDSLLKKSRFERICIGGYGFSLSNLGKEDPYSIADKARGFYYRTHNVAITFDQNGIWQIRSKRLFVPFQERIPYLKTLPFLRSLVTAVGTNAAVSFYEKGQDRHRISNKICYAPLLCYESVFPMNTAQNCSDNQFLVILANEFWNPEIRGSQQYFFTHIPTAIQSRTSIIRSSNNGISAIIDPNGKILTSRTGKNVGLINASIPLKEDTTMYEQISGIFYFSSFAAWIVLLLASLFKSRKP